MSTLEKASIEIRPFGSLGAGNFGWLDTRLHFSFSEYHNPDRMNWGRIRVWNDDSIAPQSGFPLHPHQDMEIITYVLTGAITHQDSLGNSGRTVAGDVQVMSAGTGIRHSEYNREDELTTIFQIWIIPSSQGGAPQWGTKPFPKGERHGSFQVLASGFAEDTNALPIRCNARMFGATLRAGDTVTHDVLPGRYAYLVPATGALRINDALVNARDGVAISAGRVTLTAVEDAELILVDSE